MIQPQGVDEEVVDAWVVVVVDGWVVVVVDRGALVVVVGARVVVVVGGAVVVVVVGGAVVVVVEAVVVVVGGCAPAGLAGPQKGPSRRGTKTASALSEARRPTLPVGTDAA
jgi:hypothetical protein